MDFDIEFEQKKDGRWIAENSNRERKIAALNRITGVLSGNSMTLEEARAERLKNQ